MAGLKHVSVLLEECIQALNVKPGGIYFDGTLGGGGHSYRILQESSPNGKLIATDLDDFAIEQATEKLNDFPQRFTIVKDNFKNFVSIKERLGIEGFDGILLDLGVSSFQLDDKSRGFSYLSNDELLDMRMDNKSGFSAKNIVNEYSEKDIRRILSDYGEERFAQSIAKNIVEKRKQKPIETVGE